MDGSLFPAVKMPLRRRHFVCLRDRSGWCFDTRVNWMSAAFSNRLGHERELWRQGLTRVAGVDEAGCVIFPKRRVTNSRL